MKILRFLKEYLPLLGLPLVPIVTLFLLFIGFLIILITKDLPDLMGGNA